MGFEETRHVEARGFPPAHLIAGLASIVVLTGCVTTSPIVADDPHVFLPSFRVGISLDDGKPASPEPGTGRAIEFGFVKAKGSGSQTLAAGQSPIVLNNTTFAAPQQIRNDFDLDYADISFRWRKFFGERSLGLEVRGGIGRAALGLTASSPVQQASEHFGTYGPQGGVALVWRMRPGISLHLRASGFVSDSDTGINDLARYEIFVAQSLGDHLAVRAGYARWNISGAGGADQSDFRLTLSGPVLDLGLDF